MFTRPIDFLMATARLLRLFVLVLLVSAGAGAGAGDINSASPSSARPVHARSGAEPAVEASGSSHSPNPNSIDPRLHDDSAPAGFHCAAESEILLPEVLELEAAGTTASGRPLVRVRVRPLFDQQARLEIHSPSPNSWQRQSASARRFTLRRNGPEIVRFVELDDSPAAGDLPVRANLILENEKGEATLHVARELTLNPSSSAATAPSEIRRGRLVSHPEGGTLVVYTADDGGSTGSDTKAADSTSTSGGRPATQESAP